MNVGYSLHSMADSLAMIELLRRDALVDGRFRLVETFADTEVAATGSEAAIALAFDLEDSRPLDGDLDNVARFHALGVRSLLPTYNHANSAGSWPCLDADDRGLTGRSHDLIRSG